MDQAVDTEKCRKDLVDMSESLQIASLFELGHGEDFFRFRELVQMQTPEQLVELIDRWHDDTSISADALVFMLVSLFSQYEHTAVNYCWNRVITDPERLALFYRLIARGTLGRDGLGSQGKRLIEESLNLFTDRQMINTIGRLRPPINKLLAKVHPKPENKKREALFGYLAGATVAKLESDVSVKTGSSPDRRPVRFVNSLYLPQAARQHHKFVEDMQAGLMVTPPHWLAPPTYLSHVQSNAQLGRIVCNLSVVDRVNYRDVLSAHSDRLSNKDANKRRNVKQPNLARKLLSTLFGLSMGQSTTA